MSTYRETKKEIAERMGDAHVCRQCNAVTQWGTLSDHGGLCYRCYAAYCREPRQWPDVGTKGEPRSWAHALKRRHEAGEQLTPAQVSAYRAALKEAA